MQYKYISSRQLLWLDITISLLFVLVPLAIHLPYRVNIFLSWEGAYRLYLGQIPYKDFGMPLGFGFWIIPTLFFKLLGPSFSALVKSQVLLNVISILSLRGTLYNLKVRPVLVTLSLLVFCLTYVIYNFWPWYNHSVVVYELVCIYFLTRFLSNITPGYGMINVALSALFAFLTIFTKQDVGALCFVLSVLLLSYHWLCTRNFIPLVFFVAAYFVIVAAVVLPFVKHDFLYFFNYGQAPHNSRLALVDLINVFLSDAVGEKFYLLFFVIVVAIELKRDSLFFSDRNRTILTVISVFMILQAIVTRATSPLPTDHMSYFHAFGFILLVNTLDLGSLAERVQGFALSISILCVCFSSGCWGYAVNALGISKSRKAEISNHHHSPWVSASVAGFDKVLMPLETKNGLTRLLKSSIAKKENLKVLNMSELTPLAQSMHYKPLANQPLWYHLNIGMFQKEVDLFCDRVRNGEYDLVLFEDIPDLTEFYPYQVRDTLQKYYCLQDRFLAPRKLENSVIEVYTKPNHTPGLASQ